MGSFGSRPSQLHIEHADKQQISHDKQLKNGEVIDPHLVGLCTNGSTELGLLICEFLDGQSLAKYTSTTKHFRCFRENRSLWNKLYRRRWYVRDSCYTRRRISPCVEYFSRLKQQQYANRETEHVSQYLHRHPRLCLRSRARVLDWLIGTVTAEMDALSTTSDRGPDDVTESLVLWRAVQIFDSFCASPMNNGRLSTRQLFRIAGAAIHIAMERHHPKGVVPYEDHMQTVVSRYKWRIHQCLQARIFALPTSYEFFDYYMTLCNARPFVRKYGCYLLETTLLDHTLLKYRPAKVCAACVIIALNNPKNKIVDERYIAPVRFRCVWITVICS